MVRKVAIMLAVMVSAASAAAATIDKRIIGGEDAKEGEFPFIVSVHTPSGLNCAGSLLDSTTVLTAAHCIERSYSVKAGTLSISTGGVDAKVEFRETHPDYVLDSPDSYAVNDIGILKLSTPIEKSEKISYATLPVNGSDPVVNSTAIVAGWGVQDFTRAKGSSPAGKLSKVVIPIHTREHCSKLDLGAAGRDTIVCAGGDGKNVCHYDSGGPLIDQETGQLIGIASFVIRDENNQCNLAPSVYTRVGSYIPYINEHLGRVEAKSVDQQLQYYCGSSGHEKDACLRVAYRCSGGVKPDSVTQEFRQCVDRMEVCRQAENLDHCLATIKICQKGEKLSIRLLYGCASRTGALWGKG